jgi:hypothetical protein
MNSDLALPRHRDRLGVAPSEAFRQYRIAAAGPAGEVRKSGSGFPQ